MIADVTRIFDDYLISTLGANPSVCNFILHHERKQGCIERLCEQIKGGEAALGYRAMATKQYRVMIRGVAKMFAEACLKHAEEQALSKAELERIVREAQKVERAQEIMQELEDEATDERIVSLPGQTTHAR